MFEIIDWIIQPFTKINVVKYVYSESYRHKKIFSLGEKGVRRIIYFQAVLLILIAPIPIFGLWLFFTK